MTKVALMASHTVGVEIAKFLAEKDDLSLLYVIDKDSNINKDIILNSNLAANKVFLASELNNESHTKWLEQEQPDFIITTYWPYLLKEKVFSIAKQGTVNFHPALLPANRGWYPHVHNIIDGTPAGVTLHAIDNDADTGPIWAQKETTILKHDTAKTLYERLQLEIINLFKENWPLIKSKKITPKPQDHSKANYNSKKSLDKLDQIDLDKNYKAIDLINLLRARSFGNLGFGYYLDPDSGDKVYLNLRLGTNANFDGK